MKHSKSINQYKWIIDKINFYVLALFIMGADLKQTDSDLSKAMKNPLAEVTKKSDVANAISDDKTKNLAPNQISVQLDKFENTLIRKKKFQE